MRRKLHPNLILPISPSFSGTHLLLILVILTHFNITQNTHVRRCLEDVSFFKHCFRYPPCSLLISVPVFLQSFSGSSTRQVYAHTTHMFTAFGLSCQLQMFFGTLHPSRHFLQLHFYCRATEAARQKCRDTDNSLILTASETVLSQFLFYGEHGREVTFIINFELVSSDGFKRHRCASSANMSAGQRYRYFPFLGYTLVSSHCQLESKGAKSLNASIRQHF